MHTSNANHSKCECSLQQNFTKVFSILPSLDRIFSSRFYDVNLVRIIAQPDMSSPKSGILRHLLRFNACGDFSVSYEWGLKLVYYFCWKVDEIVRIYMRGEGGGRELKPGRALLCVCFFLWWSFLLSWSGSIERLGNYKIILIYLKANLKSRFRARKYSKCVKTWHEASTSGYCSRELKRDSKVGHCFYLLHFYIYQGGLFL